jgi:hypothetical protein
LVATGLSQPILSGKKSKSSGAWRCSTHSRLISIVKHDSPYLSYSPFFPILSLSFSSLRESSSPPSDGDDADPPSSLFATVTMVASTMVTVGSHAAADRPPLGRPHGQMWRRPPQLGGRWPDPARAMGRGRLCHQDALHLQMVTSLLLAARHSTRLLPRARRRPGLHFFNPPCHASVVRCCDLEPRA